MKIKQLIVSSILGVAILALVPSASAVALAIDDSRTLGYIDAGIPADGASRVEYVNAMIGLALGGQTTVGGNIVYRSLNAFSPLNTAVLGTQATYGSNLPGSTVNIDLGSGGYLYLLAKYDGPNWGSEVWYVGGLTGIITIPNTGGQYGISGTALF